MARKLASHSGLAGSKGSGAPGARALIMAAIDSSSMPQARQYFCSPEH